MKGTKSEIKRWRGSVEDWGEKRKKRVMRKKFRGERAIDSRKRKWEREGGISGKI